MSTRPDEAIATLQDFTRCLDPRLAIVERSALEEVIAFLTKKPAITIHTQHREPNSPHVLVMGGCWCRYCGSPR